MHSGHSLLPKKEFPTACTVPVSITNKKLHYKILTYQKAEDTKCLFLGEVRYMDGAPLLRKETQKKCYTAVVVTSSMYT